jgi:hypothetical protein
VWPLAVVEALSVGREIADGPPRVQGPVAFLSSIVT